MSITLADYIRAGTALDPDEREIAAAVLQGVEDAEQAEIDAAWEVEIKQRAAEIQNGSARLVNGRVGLDQIRAELLARHS
ncbi:MAG: addiction module protein [Actinomycetaceae bacterium]|nr:addiction module protein [Actinomycetaceae bacterium]